MGGIDSNEWLILGGSVRPTPCQCYWSLAWLGIVARCAL
jgi:hypothetical protein